MEPLAPGQDGEHITYCRLCEAQCGLIAEVQDGKIIHTGPDRRHVASQGHLCVKGPAMARIAYDPDRVTEPMKRCGDPGEFEAVTWDEALDAIATELKTIVDEHGGESLGLYLGNPTAFSTLHGASGFGFVGAFGSGKVYSALHVDTTGKFLGSELVYGGVHRYTFPDLQRCDFLLMLGANPLVSHMSLISEPLARQKLDEIAQRGSVIVVDPRLTETAKRFEHLPIIPDGDIWLLIGLMKTIFSENLQDKSIEPRVSGWFELQRALETVSIEEASHHSGIPIDQIRNLAHRFSASERAACYGRVGTNRGTFPTLTNVFIEALNIITGNFGRAGGSLFGAGPYGDLPQAPGTEHGARKSRIGQIPSIMGLTTGGEIASDILTAGEDQMRALFVDSGNPVLSYPDGRKTKLALQKLDLFVSLDFYINETNRYTDYILPAVTFLERSDINDTWHATSPRPWLQYVEPVINPVGSSRLEIDIYDGILERAGMAPSLAMMSPPSTRGRSIVEDVVALQLSNRSDGLTLDMLRNDYPHGFLISEYVDAEKSWDRVSYEDGKPKLWGDTVSAEFDRLTARKLDMAKTDTLKLFGRRMLKSLNSWMHNDDRLVRSDQPTLLIHTEDAAFRDIDDGDFVTISTKTGTVRVKAEITTDVVKGSVCYPHGWGHDGGWKIANSTAGANINEIASSAPEDLEPISGACFLDGIPVVVRRA